MTPSTSDPSSAVRVRTVTASVLRSAASVMVLLFAYYAAPLDRPVDVGSWIRFGLGLLAFVGLVLWQVHAIARSDHPRLRAAQAMSTGLLLLLLLYASAYSVIGYNRPDSFTEALSRTDALYFTVTVFATVGFGDIAPRTELARIVTMTQMLVGLIAVGVIAKLLLGAAQAAVERRGSEKPKP